LFSKDQQTEINTQRSTPRDQHLLLAWGVALAVVVAVGGGTVIQVGLVCSS